MATLGAGKGASLIDREMLEKVDGRVDLGNCDKLYIDSDVDLDIMQQKVSKIKNTSRVMVPWSIYRFVLKHSKGTGDIIGYEGELPFEEAPEQVSERKDTTIKNLDSALFQRFKAQAASMGMTLGDAANQALDYWLQKVDRDYTTNKRMELLRKLEKLSDKKHSLGMDSDIFERIKRAYEKEIEKLEELEEAF